LEILQNKKKLLTTKPLKEVNTFTKLKFHQNSINLSMEKSNFWASYHDES